MDHTTTILLGDAKAVPQRTTSTPLAKHRKELVGQECFLAATQPNIYVRLMQPPCSHFVNRQPKLHSVVRKMGNFNQHVQWALWSIVFIQAGVITILVILSEEINRWMTSGFFTGEYSLLLTVLTVPIIFVFGAIAPDIDLPKDSKITKLFFNYIIPITIGAGVGFGFFRGVSYLMEEFGLFESATTDLLIYIAIASALVFAFFGWLGVQLIDRKSHHWGFTHSIVFALFLSFILFLSMWGIWGTSRILWAGIQGLAFFAGYLNHMACDQVYHELRDKHWRSPRYAFKIWSNRWGFDPFILMAEIYSPELKKKRVK